MFYIFSDTCLIISTNIRIKIVLLMVKFQSSTVVQRKLEAEFGENGPEKDWIIAAFQRFCETSTNEKISSVQEDLQKLQRKRSTKFITSPKINNKQMSGLLQWLALFSEQQHTELWLHWNLTKLNLFKNLMRKISRMELIYVKL